MACLIDTNGTAFEAASTTSFTNATHTIGAISNGVLILYIVYNTTNPSSILAKWDNTGTPQIMTQIGFKANSDNTAFAYLFGLRAPHTGLKTLAVSWTGSAPYGGITASFSGADQTADVTTFKNVTSIASTPGAGGTYPTGGLAVTTISGDMAIACFGTAWAFASGGGLGTQLAIQGTQVGGDERYLAAVGASTAIAGNATGTGGGHTYCGVAAAISAVGNIPSFIPYSPSVIWQG